MALFRGFVVVQAEVNARADFVQRILEVQIGRRGEDGVATEDEQRVDLAGLHVRDERGE